MKKEEKVTFKTNVEVQLNEKELKQASKDLAEAINRKLAIAGELKTFKDQKKAELSNIESIVQRNTLLINTGREFRMIECEWIYDWKAGKKKGVRLDNGDVVMRDLINDEERQQHLALAEKKEGANAAS